MDPLSAEKQRVSFKVKLECLALGTDTELVFNVNPVKPMYVLQCMRMCIDDLRRQLREHLAEPNKTRDDHTKKLNNFEVKVVNKVNEWMQSAQAEQETRPSTARRHHEEAPRQLRQALRSSPDVADLFERFVPALAGSRSAQPSQVSTRDVARAGRLESAQESSRRNNPWAASAAPAPLRPDRMSQESPQAAQPAWRRVNPKCLSSEPPRIQRQQEQQNADRSPRRAGVNLSFLNSEPPRIHRQQEPGNVAIRSPRTAVGYTRPFFNSAVAVAPLAAGRRPCSVPAQKAYDEYQAPPATPVESKPSLASRCSSYPPSYVHLTSESEPVMKLELDGKEEESESFPAVFLNPKPPQTESASGSAPKRSLLAKLRATLREPLS